MQTITINNCAVELRIPSVLEVSGIEGPAKRPTVRLTARDYLYDVQVKMPDGRVITVKKLYLRELQGVMLPVVDEQSNVVLFTVTDAVLANQATTAVDEPAVVPVGSE